MGASGSGRGELNHPAQKLPIGRQASHAPDVGETSTGTQAGGEIFAMSALLARLGRPYLSNEHEFELL